MDPTILQRIIEGFEQALDPGLGRIRPFLLWWTGIFILLEAVRVWGHLLEDGRRWQHGVGFVVRTLIFASIYWGWPTIMQTLVDDFVHAGLRFLDSTLTVRQVLDPGSLLAVGITTGLPLKNILFANLGITTPIPAFAFLVCWLLYICAYAWMALNVFLAQIEFAVTMPLSLMALGFIFWEPTRQMAGGVLSYALNMAFRFFLTAILTAMVFRLAPILFPPLPSSTAFAVAIEQSVIMMLAAVVIAYLFWKLPAMVAQYLTGTPTLSAGGFLQTMAGLAGLATGGAALLRAHGPAWNIRAPGSTGSPPPSTGGRLPAPPVRPSPPPPPAAQVVMSTLRSGAQFLGHDQGRGGLHVTP